MIVYNKLVRDKIPKNIRGNGKFCVVKKIEEGNWLPELLTKLDEEVGEFGVDYNKEELADILEVVYTIADKIGSSREELEQIRLKKKEEHGGFEKGIFLVATLKEEELLYPTKSKGDK